MGTIAENIKARREELEMSQEELATKTGYKHRSAVNKIELGINNFPMYKLNDFAIALRTSQERLLGYDENDLKSNESYFIVETMLTKNLRGGGGRTRSIYNLRLTTLIGSLNWYTGNLLSNA